MRLGTDEHKERFCRDFLLTHAPYDAGSIDWPEITKAEHRLLVGLPIWDEAVNTEYETAVLVRAMADHEPDPVMAEAIALQAFEEERHSELVSALTAHYGITVRRRPAPDVSDPDWAFRKSGWGESIDSFFAFGVFGLARDLRIVPDGLLAVFDLVMSEEARHIFFFENWRHYQRRSRPPARVPVDGGRDALAALLVVLARLRLAVSSARGTSTDDQNFIFSIAPSLGSLSPRVFARMCLRENDRRFAPFDPTLPRPQVIPSLVRRGLRLLPGRPLAPLARVVAPSPESALPRPPLLDAPSSDAPS
ncbi:MAG TPA: ferritin-like domain-containing protein [Acidimicrobiales bacterium]